MSKKYKNYTSYSNKSEPKAVTEPVEAPQEEELEVVENVEPEVSEPIPMEYHEAETEQYKVICKLLNVRTDPVVSPDTLMCQIKEGTCVTALKDDPSKVEGWTYIHYESENGFTVGGFVMDKFIEKV